jgi:hypothetical protein
MFRFYAKPSSGGSKLRYVTSSVNTGLDIVQCLACYLHSLLKSEFKTYKILYKILKIHRINVVLNPLRMVLHKTKTYVGVN